MEVVGVLGYLILCLWIRSEATSCTARVVGDDRAIGEIARQGHESRRIHRRSDDEQWEFSVWGQRRANVVVQFGAGNGEGIGRWISHGGLLITSIIHLL